MANEEFRELVRQFVLPVILDHRMAGHRLAATLHHRYGVSSMVCGPRKNLLDLVDPNTAFLLLFRERSASLAMEQLLDFAREYGELILLLIPMNREQRLFLDAHRDLLESHYIISDPEAVFSQAPLANF
ncbi:MAG: hypothetical protein IJY47_05525 [Clostridia bacterium]|nr:hypothetical protein [Clostridia bacterium]